MTNEVPPQTNAKKLILGHVVDGIYEMADFYDEQVCTHIFLCWNVDMYHLMVTHLVFQVLMTLDNRTLRITALPNDGGVAVNCVRLNKTDLYTENGIVHLAEAVLSPGEKSVAQLLEEDRFSKFKQCMLSIMLR